MLAQSNNNAGTRKNYLILPEIADYTCVIIVVATNIVEHAPGVFDDVERSSLSPLVFPALVGEQVIVLTSKYQTWHIVHQGKIKSFCRKEILRTWFLVFLLPSQKSI